MSLITNTITVRGKSYLVSEMDGKTMTEVRKRLANNDPNKDHEAYVSLKCCLEPKFTDINEILSQSHLVAKAISAEAFRLTDSDAEAKND